MQLKKIDLLKINIEGGEYPLLEKLVESKTIQNIQNIQIQFHDFIPDYKKRYDLIAKELQKTHYKTYDYPFIWENWMMKTDINESLS